MKQLLFDGREIMASYADISDFFQRHQIIGRKISDLRPAAFDYMIQDLDEIDDIFSQWANSSISTDAPICLIFEDGDTMEIEFSGDGPIILGFNTADISKYPEYDGSIYTLHTLFQYCIGYEILDVIFEKTNHRMQFPVYRGIDMSEDDEGISEIRFVLRGGSSLIARGWLDFFCFEHIMDFGGAVRVRYKELLSELSAERKGEIFSEPIDNHEEETWECFSATEIISDIDEVFGTFGFRDKNGKVMIEPQFLSCGEFHHGLCPVALNRTWYRTPQGIRYYEMHWGYINKWGKVVIPFKYREAWSFNKYGVAVVCDEYTENSYMIDTAGRKLENTEYLLVSHYYNYSDRFIEFSTVDTGMDNNMGLYDTKFRKVLYPPVATDFIEWDEDCICVYETGKMGFSDFHQHYINSCGEELYPHLLGRGYGIVERPNEYGYAIVAIAEYAELPDSATGWTPINGKKYRRDWQYGVAGKDGSLVIAAEYDAIKDMRDGSFECRKGDERAFIRL